MPKTLRDLEDHVSKVAEAVRVVQIDIMDGVFVKNKTWPYIKHDDFFEKIVAGEDGLPMWQDVDYEIDLMVATPFDAADHWISAGARRLLFHVETFDSFRHEKDISRDMEKALSYKNDFTEIGLAINIDTPVSVIAPYINEISCIQCMGIKRIGFQGEEFDEEVFEKVRELRELAPELPISIDGGVSEENIGELSAAGVSRFVSGSAIFNEINPIDAIRSLKQAAYQE